MEDSLLYKSKRHTLIKKLHAKGISNKQVLDAMMRVPRHIFFDEALQNHAYEDKAFPIEAGQTISQPYTVAVQSSLLHVQKHDKILEIGTGSGYQAAVLYKMGAQVFSIERQKKLFFSTKRILQDMHIHAQLFLGDGFKGLPQFAPFDKIIITAAAPFIPRTILNQLKINGIIVVPYGEGSTQKMITITKISETEFEQEEHGDFSFVPMLKGIQD
ncbi:MAG: protein-L-isoaspartate(D-aspartate) O-methyltransferase [Bacteroidales bacterium]